MSQKNRLILLFLITIFLINCPLQSEVSKDRFELTLTKSLKKVINNNPELISMGFDIKAKNGKIDRRSKLPNPEFGVEMENFAGGGEFSGFNQSEITAVLSQEIPIGPKRSLSVKIAKEEKKLSGFLRDQKLADILEGTKKRFYSLFLLQEIIALKKERVNKLKEFAIQVRKKVKTGGSSPIEVQRIDIQLLRKQVELKSSKAEFYSMGVHLASLWGEERFDYEKIVTKEDEWDRFPKEQMFCDVSELSPELVICKNNIIRSKIELKLTRSMRIPNITISGGVRRHFETGLNSFTAGISIPIPVFNLNKGAIISARYKINKKVVDFKREELRIRTELREKCRKLESEFYGLNVFKNKIIPEFNKTFKIIIDGYMAGKSSFFDVMDVYKSEYEIKEEYLRMICDCRIKMVEIERLNGRILNIINKRDENEK